MVTNVEFAKVGKNFQVRVPVNVCKDFKVKRGDKLIFIKKNNTWKLEIQHETI